MQDVPAPELILALGAADAVQLGGGVIAFVLLLGAALALLRNSYLKTQVEQLSSVIDGLRGDRDDLSTRHELVKAEVAELRKIVETQKTAIDVLQAVVTARDAVDAVARQLAAHDERCAERDRVLLGVIRASHREVVTNLHHSLDLLGDRRTREVGPLPVPGDLDDPARPVPLEELTR